MKNEALATVVPALEIFYLKERKKTLIGAFVAAEIDGDGHPGSREEGEQIVSRWGGYGKLGVVMNGDGRGPRGGGDECQFVLAAEGGLELTVTNRRLIGAFQKSRGVVGEMDLDNHRLVLCFVWDFDDIDSVYFEKKAKVFGGEKVVSANVHDANPPAMFEVQRITALDDSWTSVWTPRNDPEGLARSIAHAAARYRQGQEGESEDLLDRVLRNHWIVEGNTSTAWFVDPDAHVR